MRNNHQTTIAIVTKNRLPQLKQCLNSIKKQSLLPHQVIVIDNDPLKSAHKLCSLKKYHPLNISYLNQAGTVPHCRNMAVKICCTRYLGFIDDDCILDPNWLRQALTQIKTHQLTYVLGNTKLLNSNNILALAQHGRDAYWKKYNRQIFDTKNVIIDLAQIKPHELMFDENCQSSFYDSADFDFDFQLHHLKLPGTYNNQMIVWHQETAQLNRFCQRAFHRGKLGLYLDKKWHQHGRLSGHQDEILLMWIAKTIKNFSKDYSRYQVHFATQNKIKKLLATFFIRLFDRYYALGYASQFK